MIGGERGVIGDAALPYDGPELGVNRADKAEHAEARRAAMIVAYSGDVS